MGQQADGSVYISDLSFGLPPFGRVPGFGLRISKKAENRDSTVGAAFSRDSNDFNDFNDLTSG